MPRTADALQLDTTSRSEETSSIATSTPLAATMFRPIAGKDGTPVSAPQTGRQSFRLSSTMDSVNQVEAAAGQLAIAAGLLEDDCFHITMAVREAVINAVLHGNEYDPARQIDVTLENTGSQLIFVIRDQGKGLNPDTLPDPLAPENLLRGTGRGIFLIRSFMDEVNFRPTHPGTELTMVKRLPPALRTQ